MKLYVFLCIYLFFYSSIYSQYKNPDLDSYVKTFESAKISSMDKIEEIKIDNKSVISSLSLLDLKTFALRKYIETLPRNEFINIIEKRIKAYEEDLYKPQEYWLQHDEEIVNDRDKSLNKIRFGIYETILRSHLEELYGKSRAQLILSPIALKVKIISEESEPISIGNNDWIGIRVLSAEISDIIKGENHVKVGETIKFYFVPFWFQKGNMIVKDKEYFISLSPVVDNKDGTRRLALNVNDVNDGIIEIQRDKVIDNENYYGLGSLPWLEFKSKILTLTKLNILRGEYNEDHN